MIWNSTYIETIHRDELAALQEQYKFKIPKRRNCSVVKIEPNGTYILCNINDKIYHLRFSTELK